MKNCEKCKGTNDVKTFTVIDKQITLCQLCRAAAFGKKIYTHGWAPED